MNKKFGLRYDRVALRLLSHLKKSSKRHVPNGKLLIVAVTAPILMSGKTAQILDGKIEKFAMRKAGSISKMIILKNRIQFKLIKVSSSKKFIGFVHNPTTKPKQLFEIAEASLKL